MGLSEGCRPTLASPHFDCESVCFKLFSDSVISLLLSFYFLISSMRHYLSATPFPLLMKLGITFLHFFECRVTFDF